MVCSKICEKHIEGVSSGIFRPRVSGFSTAEQ
jgi:hypothetical protein